MDEKKPVASALEMTSNNVYYLKYIKNLNKTKKKQIDDSNTENYDSSEYYFLCYMTRKYFKDNMLYSFFKVFFGISAILLIVILDKFFSARFGAGIKINMIKTVLMTLCLGYGIVMTPLSIIYIFANFFCFIKYKDYVTTRNSALAKKIILFYSEGSDKFAAVNWKSVFKRDSLTYKEEKRMRGW